MLLIWYLFHANIETAFETIMVKSECAENLRFGAWNSQYHASITDDVDEYGLLGSNRAPQTVTWADLCQEQGDDLPTASRRLLEQVLDQAGIRSYQRSLESSTGVFEKIVDLGFGCGDQSIYLASLRKPGNESRALFDKYVGITVDNVQYDYALQRLSKFTSAQGTRPECSIEIFKADAAKPKMWSAELRQAVTSHDRKNYTNETWVLALDSLYHFSPSREPVLTYACSELQASFMAFDLLLADETTRFDRILLRIVALLMSAPQSNFITIRQYREQLVRCGYSASKLEIRDVSDRVFEPLSAFLDEREEQLRTIGLGLGAFRVAKWLFKWWARSGVVRGCIITARR